MFGLILKILLLQLLVLIVNGLAFKFFLENFVLHHHIFSFDIALIIGDIFNQIPQHYFVLAEVVITFSCGD